MLVGAFKWVVKVIAGDVVILWVSLIFIFNNEELLEWLPICGKYL